MAAVEQSLSLALVSGLLLIFSKSTGASEPFIEILDVKTNSDRSYLTTDVEIRNRSMFDLNITVLQDFIGHSLFLSIHLKAEVNKQLRTLKRWKNIDLCSFLSGKKPDPILTFMFENALRDRSLLMCPFKVGMYSLKDIYLDARRIPAGIPKSKYRFFLEVSQMMGDAAKLLSIKIDAVVCNE